MPPKRSMASPAASGGTSDGAGGGNTNADGLPHLPKLPMVRHGKQWLRCKTLRSTSSKVQLECCGFEGEKPAFWLPLTSDRLWRGSYKGKDWRHLGDGAWEPKDPGCKSPGQKGSGLKRSGSDSDSDGGDLADDEPAPCTPAAKRAGSSSVAKDVKLPISSGRAVKPELAGSGSSRDPANGRPGTARGGSGGDGGAAAVSSKPPTQPGKAAQIEGSDRTRGAQRGIKVEQPPDVKAGTRSGREPAKPSTNSSKTAAVRANGSTRAIKSATAEQPAAPPAGPPPPRATGRVRKGQQEDVGTAPKSSKVVAKQQPAAGRSSKPAQKGPALRNGDVAAPARPDSGNLSRAGSAAAQSRRGGAAADTAARAQAADGKLGAPPTPAINRKRKGSAAGGGKEQAAEAKPPPAKRQRSGGLHSKTAAAAATKARRKSPRGEGVTAPEVELPKKRGRVKQEPEEDQAQSAEDEEAGEEDEADADAPASGEASDDEQQPAGSDAKHADGGAARVDPPTSGAEDGAAEPTSRAADSSSLGSSKQPTTPQPPNGAAVETDGEAADDELRDDPMPAAEGTVAEHQEGRGGGGGSQGGGTNKSGLGRKGSDKSGKHSRSQQGAPATAAQSDGASPSPEPAPQQQQPAADGSDSPAAQQPPIDLAEGTACSDVAQRRAYDEGSGSGASNGDAAEPAPRGSLNIGAAAGGSAAEPAARDVLGAQLREEETERAAPDSRAASVAPTVAPVVAARASGAGRRKRANPPPAAAPADSLPLPLGPLGDPHGSGRWDTRSSGSLAEDAELLLLAARESVGRRHRDADAGSNGGSWGRRRALHDLEHAKMSKKDRWAAIARMIEMDDAEADSEDFDPDSGEPEPRRPPPGPGPSVRKGRWAKRNMMAAEDSPPPERAKRERSTSVHRFGEDGAPEEPLPVKRGRWAGHVKKPRANSNGTSNLKPRGSGGAAASASRAAAAAGSYAAPPTAAQPLTILRTFTALFTALGAAEKGLPPRAPRLASQARLFGSRWLQATPHAPRIVLVRSDLFPVPATSGAAVSIRPPPPVPLFR